MSMSKCPSPDEIVSLLRLKSALANSAYEYDPRTRRWYLRLDVLERAALMELGRLQRSDYSIEPDEKAIMSYRRSLPALLACLHRYFYEKKRELRNEVLTVYGPGGIGKSTLAYYVIDTAGGIILTPEDDIVGILERLFEARMWLPVIVLDDAGALVSKYWLWMPKEVRQRYIRLFDVLEYVRDITGLLLMTSRSSEGAAKRLRELQTIKGYMREVFLGDGHYVVTIIEWYDAGSNSKRPRYLDILWPGVKVPDLYFMESLEKRRRKAIELLRSIRGEDGVTGADGDMVVSYNFIAGGPVARSRGDLSPEEASRIIREILEEDDRPRRRGKRGGAGGHHPR